MSAISTSSPSEGSAGASEVRAAPLELPRPPRRSVWLLVALGAIVVGALAWWVTNSPVFQLRTLRIDGTRHLSKTEVRDLAGLSARTNVLWLRSGPVALRLERDPWIASARIERSLPGSVTITVVERAPVGVVASGQNRFLVAADGMVLGPAGAGATRALPSVEVAGGASVRAGLRLVDAPAVTAVGALPAALRGRVRGATMGPDGTIDLTLRSGIRVEFGDASEAVAKARILQALLAWAAHHGVAPAVIDVRAPDAPALLPVGAAPAVLPAFPLATAVPPGAGPSPTAHASPTP